MQVFISEITKTCQRIWLKQWFPERVPGKENQLLRKPSREEFPETELIGYLMIENIHNQIAWNTNNHFWIFMNGFKPLIN